jgi:hypothetical protein
MAALAACRLFIPWMDTVLFVLDKGRSVGWKGRLFYGHISVRDFNSITHSIANITWLIHGHKIFHHSELGNAGESCRLG